VGVRIRRDFAAVDSGVTSAIGIGPLVRSLATPGGYHYGQTYSSIGFWGIPTLRMCVCTDDRPSGFSFIWQTFGILDF
jgi:hypothetical protein